MKILNNIVLTHAFSLACVVFERLTDKPWENWAWELMYLFIAVYCALIIVISISEKVSTPADMLKTDLPLYYRCSVKTASASVCVCVLLMNLCCERGNGNIYALICLCAAAAASVKLLLLKRSIKAEFKNKESDKC